MVKLEVDSGADHEFQRPGLSHGSHRQHAQHGCGRLLCRYTLFLFCDTPHFRTLDALRDALPRGRFRAHLRQGHGA